MSGRQCLAEIEAIEKAILLLLLSLCAARLGRAAAQQYWTPANATFYGGSDASGRHHG